MAQDFGPHAVLVALLAARDEQIGSQALLIEDVRGGVEGSEDHVGLPERHVGLEDAHHLGNVQRLVAGIEPAN
ncbi:MAG TPA: hypothetical protein VKI65_15090, partial [Gemmataceae bacterium]|nr:hypothetical protein [Gemmataceae bacterium]